MKTIFIRILIAGTLVFLHLYSNSQNKMPICGWPTPPHDIESVLKRISAEKKIQHFISRNLVEDTGTLFTLPIVVHVIHTGGAIGSPDNPSDAQINAMIQVLNNSWRKAGVPLGGADMKIQFQLAIRSPGCGSTTGINRVNGSSVPNYVTDGIGIDGYPGSADQAEVKNLSRWPNTDYINIWIVNKINGTDVNIGGYAYFAQYSDAGLDGIVMNAFYVNGTNKTISHEMGHVFELYHTFYDDGMETNCPRIDSCGFYGDRVCDTEGGKVAFSCGNTTNSCTSAAYSISDPVYSYTVLNNYMNYTNCPWMFTAGQKARVRAALLAFRPGLISSGGLTPAPGASPAVACTPSASFGLSPYFGIERVVFNTLNVYSNSSLGDRALYNDRSCNQRTVVAKGQTYPLMVIGTYLNYHSIKAFLDYNNDGDFDDAGELLLADYKDSGIANVTIPASGVLTGIPLRLRIVADNPAPGYPTNPTACLLNGTSAEGAGQVEDYAVIISTGVIQSITSGSWNNPATWNCNCIPTVLDEVIVKNSHTVSVTQAMGLVECAKLTVETGGNFTVNSNAAFRQHK